MTKTELLNQILSVLQAIKEDEDKLQQVHDFVMEEIYEEEQQVVEVPEKYKKLVHEIADYITSGFVCYLNPKTLEHEHISKQILDDPDEYESATGETIEGFNLKHETWDSCIVFEPLESYESFQIMKNFVSEVPETLQNKLTDSLNRSRPFAKFKNIIDNSEFRYDWFEFRHERVKKIVFEKINNQI